MKHTVIQSLSRGLRILDLVSSQPGGVALVVICRETGLHRSTAHHLLQTLVLHGYLAQDEATRAYRLGARVFHLASTSWSEGQLAHLALPYLQELVRRTGESTNLAVRKDDQAILVETMDGQGTLRVVDRVGAARPIHASAIGKVVLAWAPETEREAILQSLKLKAFTTRTIVDRTKLRRELNRVRTAGYALDDEEMAQGVRCVAAPVFGVPGRIVGAIGIAGPAARVSMSTLVRYSRPLMSAVRRLSDRLSQAIQ
ncbi:MAG: IclR family transcriptional regulator [Betaproteobacteria bacterium]